MRLLVNILHHFSRLYKVIWPLEFWMAITRCRCRRQSHWIDFWWLWHRAVLKSRWVFLKNSIACEKVLACLVVYLYLFFKNLAVLLIASHFISCEKGLSLVFEGLHEAFGLEVRIESHWGPNLFDLLPRAHTPSNPLRLSRLAVDVTVSSNGWL